MNTATHSEVRTLIFSHRSQTLYHQMTATCLCVEYSRFEAKIREIREQMLQTTTGNGGLGGIQTQQQTGRFVRYT